MENSLLLRCLMLTMIGAIGYAEGKTDMFELLMSRKQCLKESTKEQCKIEFMKTICANKKSSELGDETVLRCANAWNVFPVSMKSRIAHALNLMKIALEMKTISNAKSQ